MVFSPVGVPSVILYVRQGSYERETEALPLFGSNELVSDMLPKIISLHSPRNEARARGADEIYLHPEDY